MEWHVFEKNEKNELVMPGKFDCRVKICWDKTNQKKKQKHDDSPRLDFQPSLTYQQWMHSNTCHRFLPGKQTWRRCGDSDGAHVEISRRVSGLRWQRRDKASTVQTDTSCVSYSSRNEFNLCLPMELLTLNNLQGVFACQGSSEIMRVIIPPEF